jgi:hypothetical protein
MTGLLQKQRNSPQAQCACGETRCLAGECKEGLARVAPTVIVGRREEATQRGKKILQEFHELASEIAPAKFGNRQAWWTIFHCIGGSTGPLSDQDLMHAKEKKIVLLVPSVMAVIFSLASAADTAPALLLR